MEPEESMRMRLAIALTLALASLACKNPLDCLLGCGTSKRTAVSLTNQLGALISDSARENVWSAWWSPDGRTIYYQAHLSSGAMVLRGLDVATRARWTVDSEAAGMPAVAILSAEGTHFYFLGVDSATAVNRLYRVPVTGGAPALVLDSVSEVWASAGGRVVYTPWQCTVGCRVWVLDTVSGARRNLGSGVVAAVSPDGREVLLNDYTGTYVVASLVDGSTTSTTFVSEWWNRTYRWAAEGPWTVFVAMYADSDEIRARNITSGEERLLHVETLQGGAGATVWSEDGSRIAFWGFRCFSSSFMGGCYFGHAALYTVDVQHRKETWVAGADGFSGMTVLAPDGTQVLYTVQQFRTVNVTLRLSPVP